MPLPLWLVPVWDLQSNERWVSGVWTGVMWKKGKTRESEGERNEWVTVTSVCIETFVYRPITYWKCYISILVLTLCISCVEKWKGNTKTERIRTKNASRLRKEEMWWPLYLYVSFVFVFMTRGNKRWGENPWNSIPLHLQISSTHGKKFITIWSERV